MNEIRELQRRILLEKFYQAIHIHGVVVWLGTRAKWGKGKTQSLVAVTGDGNIASRYDKTKLVPLWEYIPFEPVLGKVLKLIPTFRNHMLSGQPNQQFNTPFGKAIVGICYDSAFAQLFHAQAKLGGQFIITASNNNLFNSIMLKQHHAQDIMRSIETDCWPAHATNTGISSLIDPHGNTHWNSKIGTYETHIATIYRRTSQTPYVRWGNWLTPLLFVLGIYLEHFMVNRKY